MCNNVIWSSKILKVKTSGLLGFLWHPSRQTGGGWVSGQNYRLSCWILNSGRLNNFELKSKANLCTFPLFFQKEIKGFLIERLSASTVTWWLGALSSASATQWFLESGSQKIYFYPLSLAFHYKTLVELHDWAVAEQGVRRAEQAFRPWTGRKKSESNRIFIARPTELRRYVSVKSPSVKQNYKRIAKIRIKNSRKTARPLCTGPVHSNKPSLDQTVFHWFNLGCSLGFLTL